MQFDRKKWTNSELIKIYQSLIFPRLIEEKMLTLLRQGEITKWFSGIGQEATSVGAALGIDHDEYILPMHRNLGVFTTRGVSLPQLFEQFQGKLEGFTKGRDRSFHFGSQKHKIVGMISHLGPQLGVADGIALSHLLKKEKKLTLVFTGDGGTSEGDFHEALNVASVWNLPVIFLIENNGYGLSTPSSEQFNFESFVVKGPAYGIEAISIDGNNILEVIHETKRIAHKIRNNPQPIIVEARTFRMRGHEEASGTKYVPKELMEKWSKLDPIENYEQYLVTEKVLTQQEAIEIKKDLKNEIATAIHAAFNKPLISPNSKTELLDVYQPYQVASVKAKRKKSSLRFVDAIHSALDQALEKYPELIVMGQDIAEYGGVFKVTEGFSAKYGKERIRNTPLCESAIIGMGLGLSINGYKTVIEMQFADFVSSGFTQIVNNLAKSYYRWGQSADVVIRMPTGANVTAGPYHSQSTEAWFFHVPGLKIVYPSNPEDAKGLLCAAIEDPNPVLFYEHKYLYRSLSGDVHQDYFTTPIGKAARLTKGNELCIITYGLGVQWAMDILKELSIDGTVLDLRTLQPWDKEAVKEVVMETNKALILHEDTLTGGIGGEIAAWIGEHCFEWLDAPVMRCASLDTPVPFARPLEENFLAKSRLKSKINELIRY